MKNTIDVALIGIGARVNAHQRAEIGQKLELAFDLKKCHFFDGVTEKTIV